MEFLNVKEKNLSIIVPFKSGHTLLRTTFIHLFKHLNIDVELEFNPNNFLENVYIFVRNPIDRFFSSYFWLYYMLNDDKESINISNYIRNYENFLEKTEDSHFITQSTYILYNYEKLLKNEIINNEIQIKSLYENKFGTNYKIFKIEDIDKIIDESKQNLISKNVGFENKFEALAFNMDKFNFLETLPNESSFLFTTFYLFFKNLYQTSTHHKNISYVDKVTLQEYQKVSKITKNEYDFFGYDEKIIDEKLFKRNVI
jgi:hypothetical protein